MTRVNSRVRFPYLLPLALAAAVNAFPQITHSTSGDMLHADQPRAGISGIMRGKPLHARFELSGPHSRNEEGLWVSEIWRNQAGSIRTNLSGNNNFSWILDVGRQRLVALDLTSKTAVMTPMKLDDSHPMWGFNKKSTPTNESAVLLGITCNRILLLAGDPASTDAGEVWTANDLGIVMKDIKPVPGGNLVWRATSIELAEPDIAVFEILPGYKVASP
jgi:hypothetical protein